MRLPLSFVAFAILCPFNAIFAEDVFRFRGENSLGKYNEPGLLDSWPEGGLIPKWINSDLGEGWSSVIKVKDRLYLNCLDAEDTTKESVVCLDLNGKKLWEQTVGGVHKPNYSFPRITPAYIVGDKPGDDKLIVLCGGGELYCLAAADGKKLWNHDVFKDHQASINMWGVAENVVTKDGRVFVTLVGKNAFAVAYNIADGSVAWKTPPQDDRVTYVTPILYENTLVTLAAKYVWGIDTETGQVLWKSDFLQDAGGKVDRSGNGCTPFVIKGNQFFVTHGYGQGSVMYEILPDGKGIEKRWASKAIDGHHHGAVEIDGRIYGSDHGGGFCCLDWNTGETIYKESWGNAGASNTIFADGKMFLYDEKRGMLGLVKPGDKLDVVGSFPIDFGTQQHWTHQVISDGVLYVRHGNALAAFDIRKK